MCVHPKLSKSERLPSLQVYILNLYDSGVTSLLAQWYSTRSYLVAQQKVLSSNPVYDISFSNFQDLTIFSPPWAWLIYCARPAPTGHAHARIYAHRATVGIFFNKNRVQKATKRRAAGSHRPCITQRASIPTCTNHIPLRDTVLVGLQYLTVYRALDHL